MGNDRAEAYTIAAAVICSAAFLAGSVTANYGRKLAIRFPSLPYAVVATLILLITFAPLFLIVGL